ncbi:hypothetical protein MKX03_034467, partial [Papaver bracteatum]
GRAVAAATTSFRGTVSSISSFYGRANSGSASTGWISGATAFLLQMERTFIAIKPDGVQRGLISEIVGFKLVAIKLIVPSKDFAQKHYHDLKERTFFNGLCDFLSGPVLAMVKGKQVSMLIQKEAILKMDQKCNNLYLPAKS